MRRLSDPARGTLWTPRRIKLLWAVYWLALFASTHTPKKNLPHVPYPWIDKVVHVSGYAGLALFAAWHARRRRPATALPDALPRPPDTAAWRVKWLGILLAYGALDEWTQPLVHRSRDWSDWLADGSGVLLAFAVLWILRRKL